MDDLEVDTLEVIKEERIKILDDIETEEGNDVYREECIFIEDLAMYIRLKKELDGILEGLMDLEERLTPRLLKEGYVMDLKE